MKRCLSICHALTTTRRASRCRCCGSTRSTPASWRTAAGPRWRNKGFDDPALFAAWLRTLSWNCVTATDPNLFQAPFRAPASASTPTSSIRCARRFGCRASTCSLPTMSGSARPSRRASSRASFCCAAASTGSSLPAARDAGPMAGRDGGPFRPHVHHSRPDVCHADAPRARIFGQSLDHHSRFLISHRLLIDEAYASGLRDWLGEFAPQTLLILDEAHNAAPASGVRYAIDSRITRAVRDISPRFEHRLFLSATPHNGIRTASPPCSKFSIRNVSAVVSVCSRVSLTRCWSGGSSPISGRSKAVFPNAR